MKHIVVFALLIGVVLSEPVYRHRLRYHAHPSPKMEKLSETEKESLIHFKEAGKIDTETAKRERSIIPYGDSYDSYGSFDRGYGKVDRTGESKYENKEAVRYEKRFDKVREASQEIRHEPKWVKVPYYGKYDRDSNDEDEFGRFDLYKQSDRYFGKFDEKFGNNNFGYGFDDRSFDYDQGYGGHSGYDANDYDNHGYSDNYGYGDNYNDNYRPYNDAYEYGDDHRYDDYGYDKRNDKYDHDRYDDNYGYNYNDNSYDNYGYDDNYGRNTYDNHDSYYDMY